MNSSTRPLYFIVGVNYKTSPHEERSELNLSESQIRTAYAAISKEPSLKEAMILSTCNRMELVGVLSSPRDAEDTARHLFVCLQAWAGKGIRATRVAEASHLNMNFGLDAVSHVLKIPSGVSSMVIGETQIASQWKKAFEIARSEGTIGAYMHKLHQTALAVSKKIRTSTAVGRGRVSLAHAAVDVAETSLDLKASQVLVIGAGEMGGLTLKALRKKETSEIVLCNRTKSNTDELVKKIKGVKVCSFTDLEKRLKHVDLVVTATAAKKPIIDAAMLSRVLAFRGTSKPLTIIDISLAGDVCPRAQQLEGLRFYSIDDIGKLVSSSFDQRMQAVAESRKYIVDGSGLIAKWIDHQSTSETLRNAAKAINNLLRCTGCSGEVGRDHDCQKRIVQTISKALKTAIENPTNKSGGEGLSRDEMIAALNSFIKNL